MTNILVTGGFGFIGSNFISKILNSNNLIVNVILKRMHQLINLLDFESHKNYNIIRSIFQILIK